MPAPPYGYGGTYPTQYGYPQNNREAMLRALAEPDNPTYQYPSGRLQNVALTPGRGVQTADRVTGLASTVAPQIAAKAAGQSLIGSGATAGLGLGTGIGIGAEILGSYL